MPFAAKSICCMTVRRIVKEFLESGPDLMMLYIESRKRLRCEAFRLGRLL